MKNIPSLHTTNDNKMIHIGGDILKTNFLKLFSVPITISLVLCAWYQMAESPLEKLLILFTALTVFIPALLQLFSFCINIAVKPVPKSHRTVNSKGELIKTDQNNKTTKKTTAKKHKPKKVDSECYLMVRDTFIEMNKSKDLSRENILEFKRELNRLLGSHLSNYEKFEFANDFHEIYCKLKSSALKDKDYIYLFDILTSHRNLIEKDIVW